jgi:uncharacterized membrane protein YdjX (TVP38/TMEM64 family)
MSTPRKFPFQIVAIVAIGLAIVLIPPIRDSLGHGLALLATGQLGQFQEYLLSLGPWAPLASIALMTTQALLIPVPITIVMVANGLVFGLWMGMLVSLAGGLMGGFAAYSIGRWLGRALVEKLLPAGALAAADRLMAKYGGWAVVLERWIPGVPGDPVSYASGLTRMPLWKFLGLTMIGLVPANIVTAYVGTEVAGDIPIKWWLLFWGVVIGLWAAYVLWKRSRRRPGL